MIAFRLVSTITVTVILTIAQPVSGQNLKRAVSVQLAEAGGQPCALLLGGDSADVLGNGELNAICTRPVFDVPVGFSPSPSADGVGALSLGVSVQHPKDVEPEDQVAERAEIQRGFFFSVGHEASDRIASPFEDAYVSEVWRISTGFDRLVGKALTLGVAADGSLQDGEFRSPSETGFFRSGEFEIQTIGLTGFGTYWLGDAGSFDFQAGYSKQSNERVRTANSFAGGVSPYSASGTPAAEFDADQFFASLLFSHNWRRNNFLFGPRIGYDWGRSVSDTYSEVDDSGLALTFHDDNETSAQLSGGLAGSAAFGTNFGVLLFGGSAMYKYESQQDQRDVEVSFVEDTRARRFIYQTEKPDRDYVEYLATATFVLPNGVQLFLVYRGITSHDYVDIAAGFLGFRKEF